MMFTDSVINFLACLQSIREKIYNEPVWNIIMGSWINQYKHLLSKPLIISWRRLTFMPARYKTKLVLYSKSDESKKEGKTRRRKRATIVSSHYKGLDMVFIKLSSAKETVFVLLRLGRGLTCFKHFDVPQPPDALVSTCFYCTECNPITRIIVSAE